MRSIARQSARLASNSRARQPSLPRHVCIPHHRGLHSSIPRLEARDPNNHTDIAARIERQLEDDKVRDNDLPKVEQSGEEGKKPTLRKTLRRQRTGQDRDAIPDPPPLPDWFLRHNVSLQPVEAEPGSSTAKTKRLRCVDKESGHTLFDVPYFPLDGNPPSRVSTSPRTKRGDGSSARMHMDNIEARLAKAEAAYTAISKKLQTLRENRQSSKETRPGEDGAVGKDGKDKKPSSFFDQNAPGSPRLQEPQTLPTAVSGDAKDPKKDVDVLEGFPDRSLPGHDTYISLLRWTILEIETGIQAGFTAAAQARQSASQAASRVDISLQCPDSQYHDQMDNLVQDLATITQAAIIRLDANDFADLTSEYVGQGADLPGGFSNLAYDVFDGYGAVTAAERFGQGREEAEQEEDEEDEEEEADGRRSNPGFSFLTPAHLGGLRKVLMDRRHDLAKAFGSMKMTGGIAIGMPMDAKMLGSGAGPQDVFRPQNASGTVQWDDSRLVALLDALLDAPKLKEAAHQSSPFADSLESRLPPGSASVVGPGHVSNPSESRQEHKLLWRICAEPGRWKSHVAQQLASRVKYQQETAGPTQKLHGDIRLEPDETSPPAAEKQPSESSKKTIVHVRDLKDICRSRIGDAIIQRLVRVVQKRRRAGEQIAIVGTTAEDMFGRFAISSQDEGDMPFRTLTIPPVFFAVNMFVPGPNAQLVSVAEAPSEQYSRILEINLRNIQSMLHRLRPTDSVNLFTSNAQYQIQHGAGCNLGEQVLSLGQVHRIVLTAIGLSQIHAVSDVVHPIHIRLATVVTRQADHAVQSWSNFKQMTATIDGAKPRTASGVDDDKSRLERIKKSCNPHETRLLNGVVDPQNIKTGFASVHAPPETIEALKTLTSLSLLRPDAFKYGVLAQDRLPGLLLYGPPGTGKTLLAKAVAKDSRSTVLEISGAQIYEKYVGEGEKMVRAVFSLAKKLAPCIVFLDEADAIFGSRSNAGNRNTHREIINQFLREWDGMDMHNVFIMVASNRPFDLDDAVLRRLPRRVLVDLPVAKDREAILRIHLRDETLDPKVDLPKLAEQTPLYSGSDLKNLCVSAALACVREEMEAAAAAAESKPEASSSTTTTESSGTTTTESFDANATPTKSSNATDAEKAAPATPEPTYPPKRILLPSHFDKAIREISASISEDMSSLTAIRKFDEQFGDRRGRKKKLGYGFGLGGDAVPGAENTGAMVRPPGP